MVGPSPHRLPAEISDLLRADQQRKLLFDQMFGADWDAHRVLGFIVGPSEDNKMVGFAFTRADGGSTCICFDADLLPEFGACLGLAWQHVSDTGLLSGPSKGTG